VSVVAIIKRYFTAEIEDLERKLSQLLLCFRKQVNFSEISALEKNQ